MTTCTLERSHRGASGEIDDDVHTGDAKGLALVHRRAHSRHVVTPYRCDPRERCQLIEHLWSIDIARMDDVTATLKERTASGLAGRECRQ
jgi:hypothetical protein